MKQQRSRQLWEAVCGVKAQDEGKEQLKMTSVKACKEILIHRDSERVSEQ